MAKTLGGRAVGVARAGAICDKQGMKLTNCHKLCAVLLLAGCTGANHLGNPLTLPARAVLSSLSEAGYAARRARVKAHLVEFREAFQSGPLPHVTQQELFDTGGTPPEVHVKVLSEIKALPPGPGWAEQATVIVMVHS